MELLESCREQAHKSYGDLLLAAEKTLTDTLFEQAEQSNSNEEQRRFYEAMQLVKARGGAMQAAFRQQMLACFQAFTSGNDEETTIEEQVSIGNLSLVQRDELEDELAISVIISKSNSRNSETLWKLNKRMAVLRGGKTVSDETNPFGPAMICKALQVGVAELNVDSKTKIIIYKHFGKILVISFSKVLNALNDTLTDKGILPNLRFSLAKSSESSESDATATDNDAPSEAIENLKEAPSSVMHQREVYSAIRNLQSRNGPRTHSAGGVDMAGIATDGSGGGDTFGALDYALALTAIQQSKAFLSAANANKPLPVNLVEEQLFGKLADSAQPEAQHKMSRDHADTVDLVGMIFRYMLDDPHLHDGVKSLLSHLHTPYLKLALMDKTFLDNYEHSARVLLNSMAEVGGKWVKEDNDRMVLPKIRTVVETVLKGFVDDASIFDQLLDDFSRFKENLEKRARMVEKRNTESQQGLEKLELSKQRAADEVVSRMEQAAIDEKVADLLQQPWTDFLAFNLLRHGDEGLTWQSALKVLDGVVWSVRPDAIADSKEDLQRRQHSLEQSVSEGLQTIGYDTEASKGLLKSLKEAQELAYHSAVMTGVTDTGQDKGKPQAPAERKASSTEQHRSTDPKANASAAQPQPTTAETKPTPRPKPRRPAKPKPPPMSAEESSMVDKLKEIAFGTWFEFDRDKGSAHLKLAWFSRVTSHYMFVDHTGVKQAVETQINLAKGMCAGHIRIVEPGKKSFMERALESVLSTLKMAG